MKTNTCTCMCSGGVVRMALHQRINWGSASTECHCQFRVFKHWEYTVSCQEFLHRAWNNLILKDLLCPGAPGVFNPTEILHLAVPRQCFAQLSWASEMRALEHTEPKVRTKKCSFSYQSSPCSLGILATAPQREDVLELWKNSQGNGHRGIPSHGATSPR